MANMSAQILRNLVSSVFNVKATEVVLSGEIASDSTWYQGNTRGGMWNNDRTVKVWGFNPHSGFCHITDCVGDEIQSCNDAPVYFENATPLAFCEKAHDSIFFVVNIRNNYYDSNGRDDNEDSWTLYKAPDFGAYLASVEKQDLERWESWVKS